MTIRRPARAVTPMRDFGNARPTAIPQGDFERF
jgi:hypothetical protein